MRFSFMSAQTFNVSGKAYEKLSEVINRFKSQCPEELKKLLPFCIYNAKPVDKNKSLQELGIKFLLSLLKHNLFFCFNQ